MRLYKILEVNENRVFSPFQGYYYGTLRKIFGKELICKNFDESNNECSNGFYAVDIDGLIYFLNKCKYNKVFEVEVGGKRKEFDQFKRRFEKQKIIRMLDEEKVKELIRKASDKMDYNYYEMCYPLDPRSIECGEVNNQVIELLKKWDSVFHIINNSVYPSIYRSIYNPIYKVAQESFYYSLYYHIGIFDKTIDRTIYDYATECACAYLGSLFFNIEKWIRIEHKKGEYPFQCGVELLKLGFIPIFDGSTWRLHAGKDMKIVYEISREKLKNE